MRSNSLFFIEKILVIYYKYTYIILINLHEIIHFILNLNQDFI